MSDPNTINEFILYRAQGLTLNEIGAKTGLQRPLLEAWDDQYRAEVERVKDSVLEKVAAFIFEDLKKQLALHDALISSIEEKTSGLMFHPAHAEKAYSSISSLLSSRTKVMNDTLAFLTKYAERREEPSSSKTTQSPRRKSDVL